MLDPLDAEIARVVALLGAPAHARERERLTALLRVAPFAHADDAYMRSLACQASEACGTEYGLVSLMDEYEERFLGCSGIELATVERMASFCAHTILEPGPLLVEDALADPRFRDNPFVVGEPHVRFYLGAPIIDPGGLPIGSVCAVGLTSRFVSSSCVLAVQALADRAGVELEARRTRSIGLQMRSASS